MSDVKPELRFTYEDYRLMPEDKRYELIDGDLTMVPAPKPYHQIVTARIEDALRRFAERRELGIVLDAPCDVYLSRYDVVQPDVLFIVSERVGIVKENYIQGPPDLVVEVMSPTHPDRDHDIKGKLYSRYGVREYWIADPDAHSIEVLSRQENELRLVQTYVTGDQMTSPLLVGFRLALSEVFKAFP